MHGHWYSCANCGATYEGDNFCPVCGYRNPKRLYARIRMQTALAQARDLLQADFSRFVDGRGNQVYTAADARRNVTAICGDAIVTALYPIASRLLRGVLG